MTPSYLNDEELRHARDLGAVTFLGAYIHLMDRKLHMEEQTNQEVNRMASKMIEPLNLAARACYFAMMSDRAEVYKAVKELQEALTTLP